MKILIWGEIKNGGPYDIFRVLDYKNIFSELQQEYNANFMNIGNKVWIQGIVSTLSTEDNELYFYNPAETWEEINSKYDKIVYSAANMISPYFKTLIKQVADIFYNSKIPVYVISIGAQSDNYDGIELLVSQIKDETAHFIDSIYSTGGEIACRGNYTKEVLDRVASNTAQVIGCPSLYQNGRNLKITKSNKLNKIAINGNFPLNSFVFEKFPGSVYFDQDMWLRYTYNLSHNNNLQYLAEMISQRGRTATESFLYDRIKIFYDVPEWRRYLTDNKFDLSIGSRIHGNIISLLANIPSVVFTIDSRTQEIAEYYNIPTINTVSDYEHLQDLFDSLNYDDFNSCFPSKFDKYESFLIKCGLVKSVNQNNSFWSKEKPINTSLVNSNKIQLQEDYKKMKPIIYSMGIIKRYYNRIWPQVTDVVTKEEY